MYQAPIYLNTAQVMHIVPPSRKLQSSLEAPDETVRSCRDLSNHVSGFASVSFTVRATRWTHFTKPVSQLTALFTQEFGLNWPLRETANCCPRIKLDDDDAGRA